MSYKTLLAVLQSKEDATRVLDCAVPLASHLSAHLIGIHAEPMPIPYATPMGFPDTDFIAAGTELNQQRSDEIKALFQSRVSREGLSSEWQAMESFSGDSALSAVGVARSCDLVVVQQSDPEQSSASIANVEALLFESGRPVLFVPYAAPVNIPFKKVLVAWNGTHEAARATFDALPFIVAAREVEILSLDASDTANQDSAVAGADISSALARHGAKITFSSEVTAGLSAGEAIENQIAETGADLLVMGAYSQSWLKEFFFGGATRTLLRSMPTATLMSR
ncbi:universal stress protein [Aquamicrobium sp. LC103]|uniref:universal stress protein n=1 Tax=Aquamicrobium sp. LC103 TaxID=1120658 RepID=UPI00063EAABB|nr:universal stress protein [Aquamicrobium sp. LC103]TKT79054.1 universal stress protein [Aquamicrobium sp. LC103]